LQRLGQQTQGIGAQGKLAGLGPEGDTGDANDIAEVELAKDREGVFADIIPTDVDLQSPLAVLNLDKGGLAEIAPGHDPAGDDVALIAAFQGGGIVLFVGGGHLFRGMRHGKIVGVGIDPRAPQLIQLGPPL